MRLLLMVLLPMSISSSDCSPISHSTFAPSQSSIGLLLAMCCLAPLLFAGCSRAEIKQAFDEAKNKTKSLTESAVDKIEEKLPESGQMSLESEPPIGEVQQLDLQLIDVGDGRANVVQVVSYDLSRPGRQFPSVMLHGTTTVGTASSLVGQTIACDVYLQAGPNDPIAMTPPGSSVEVTFDAFDASENTLRGRIGAVDLLASDDQSITIRGGQITAVIREVSE